MKITFKEREVLVEKEEGDAPIYGESVLFHKIKSILNANGFDIIKKLMWKDGHLVSEQEYYLRDRKWRWCIHDNHFAVRNLAEDYRLDGNVSLDFAGLQDMIITYPTGSYSDRKAVTA